MAKVIFQSSFIFTHVLLNFLGLSPNSLPWKWHYFRLKKLWIFKIIFQMRVTTRYMGELRVSNHEKQSCFAACLVIMAFCLRYWFQMWGTWGFSPFESMSHPQAQTVCRSQYTSQLYQQTNVYFNLSVKWHFGHLLFSWFLWVVYVFLKLAKPP